MNHGPQPYAWCTQCRHPIFVPPIPTQHGPMHPQCANALAHARGTSSGWQRGSAFVGVALFFLLVIGVFIAKRTDRSSTSSTTSASALPKLKFNSPTKWTKDGATWEAIIVNADATDAQLCELGSYLRTQSDRRFYVFTSPSRPDIDAFVAWTTTYPATRRSPKLVAWMKKHHRGTGRPSLGGGWALALFRDEIPSPECPI